MPGCFWREVIVLDDTKTRIIFPDNQIRFDYVIGVSAGAGKAALFISGQRGRGEAAALLSPSAKNAHIIA